MNKTNALYKIWDLYYDGFRHMTLGKTLWMVILIKLFIIFVILKIFFFPDTIKQNAPKGQEAAYVEQQLQQHAEE
ncbi:MAG: DUF4492 domain-containing protein [Prevotella sp.]|jgi:hypothetical protein